MKITVTVDQNTYGDYQIDKYKTLIELFDYGDPVQYGPPDISISFSSVSEQLPRGGHLIINRDDAIKLAYSILAVAAPRNELQTLSI